MFKRYYYLTKPGIIYGNLLNTIAGFFLASNGVIDSYLLLATIVGTSGIIASACVINNYIDRDLDKNMARTKRRALVQGTIPVSHALVLSVTLGLVGAATLLAFTNLLTLTLGLFGFFAYLVLYGIAKRRSVHGTLIGSISGSIPPVAGYTAVTNEVDLGAMLLFLILVAWQMAHFYAIAIYRQKDYAAAGLPVLPVVKGVLVTRKQIIAYIVLFGLTNAWLSLAGYTGILYLGIMLSISALWLHAALRPLPAKTSEWGKDLFLFSLKVIICLDVMLAVGGILP